MTVLMGTRVFFERHGAEIDRISAIPGPRGPIERVVVPDGPDDRVAPEDLERITVAFASGDMNDRPEERLQRKLYGGARRAAHLEWLHAFNVGTDDPIFGELMDKGVVVSNSAGASAEPIAQMVLTNLLTLARNMLHYHRAQRAHEWSPVHRPSAPEDLRGQTVTIVGLGSIGGFLASYLRPLGVHIIGVRRRPAGPEDGVDEWIAPDRLAEVLPRTRWLVLCAPLTEQTRGMIDAHAIASLPRGASVLNVGRGALVDEPALISALQSGHLAGAYLDVFAEEPLPAESPLWDMPNVILTPHDASTSRGNTGRADRIFLEELERWQRGELPTRLVTER